MPRFYFDISDGGDVYHDASGIILPSFGIAKERAFEIVRKMGPRGDRDIICTVRDPGGRSLMQIKMGAGEPTMGGQNEKPQR